MKVLHLIKTLSVAVVELHLLTVFRSTLGRLLSAETRDTLYTHLSRADFAGDFARVFDPNPTGGLLPARDHGDDSSGNGVCRISIRFAAYATCLEKSSDDNLDDVKR